MADRRVQDLDSCCDQRTRGRSAEFRPPMHPHLLPPPALNTGHELGNSNAVNDAQDLDTVVAIDEPGAGIKGEHEGLVVRVPDYVDDMRGQVFRNPTQPVGPTETERHPALPPLRAIRHSAIYADPVSRRKPGGSSSVLFSRRKPPPGDAVSGHQRIDPVAQRHHQSGTSISRWAIYAERLPSARSIAESLMSWCSSSVTMLPRRASIRSACVGSS